MNMQIAIDGPVGAGKSTIARECAKQLGFVYMDTGALYRAVGLYCKSNGVDSYDETAVSEVLENIKLEIRIENHEQHIITNSEDVTKKIREPEISMLASKVSSYAAVRAFLLDLQRDFAETNNVIMDGRDIGTVVLPDARVKIFLTADPKERARRRHEELKAKGSNVTFDEVLSDLEKRDKADSSRANAPLKQADDAVLLDTTKLSFELSVQRILEIIKNKQ